jgi:protein-S-isoprenylcysteine O-methyltransferase Ste14
MLVIRALGAALVIVAIWFVGVPCFLVSSGAEPFPLDLGRLRLLGVLPLLTGALLFFWVTWIFAFVGGGTPLVFDSPVRLVSIGPYSRVRNPMYIADTLIVTGEAVLLESSAILLYAGLLWLGLHLLVVVLEEPRLRRRFGARYKEYCGQVPRWIPAPTKAAEKRTNSQS